MTTQPDGPNVPPTPGMPPTHIEPAAPAAHAEPAARDVPAGPAAPARPTLAPDLAIGGATDAAPGVPGVPRRSFDRLPTAPLPAQVATGPAEDGTVSDAGVGDVGTAEWTPAPTPAVRRRGLGGVALALSVVGLAVSLFVGWGFPLGIAGIATAAVAMRRPAESRRVAGWALALGIVSVLYSAGWIVWALTRPDPFG